MSWLQFTYTRLQRPRVRDPQNAATSLHPGFQQHLQHPSDIEPVQHHQPWLARAAISGYTYYDQAEDPVRFHDMVNPTCANHQALHPNSTIDKGDLQLRQLYLHIR